MRSFIAVVLLSALPAFPAAEATTTEDQELPIVGKYVGATERQQEALRGAQMEVDIDAKLIKLQKQGRLRAMRMISQLGQITYRALGFSGDNTVKQEVITRFLAAESEGRENGTISITPSNYKFKYKGKMEWYGRSLVILQIQPRRNAVGLFKGELWVDSETGMPMREAGQFVKTPSIFLKKVVFVREYDLKDGMSIPRHLASTVDTRIAGRAEMQIEYSHFLMAGQKPTDPAAGLATQSSATTPTQEVDLRDTDSAVASQ